MSEVKFYINSSPNNKMDKELQLLKDTNIELKDDIDILNPTITMNKFSNCHKVNYIYIAKTQRYYYARPTLDTGNTITFSCDVDVWMSHKSKIRSTSQTVTRNQFKKNGYLPDNKYMSYAYEQIVTKAFPNEMLGDSIILMTVG